MKGGKEPSFQLPIDDEVCPHGEPTADGVHERRGTTRDHKGGRARGETARDEDAAREELTP